MKVLEKEFKQKGFNLKLVKRIDDIAIYQRSNKLGFIHWEVVVIRRHNGFKIAGNEIPPSEYYPSDNDWGQFGWTFLDKKLAETAFNNLLKNV